MSSPLSQQRAIKIWNFKSHMNNFRNMDNSVGCVTFKQNCLDREFRTKYDLIIGILCNLVYIGVV